MLQRNRCWLGVQGEGRVVLDRMKAVSSVATVYFMPPPPSFVIYMPPSQGSAHILVSALVQRGVSCTVTFVLSVISIALRRTDNRNLPFLFLEVQRGPVRRIPYTKES